MGEMRSFLPSRCALGDLRAQLVTPPERAATGTPRPARKNILREAQAFADSMPISRHRGRVYLSASRWWKTGGLTREWDFHQRWATIFTTPMAMVDIGRNLAKGQRPAERRTARSRTANLFALGQLFLPTRVHTGTKRGASQKVARKSTEQTGPKARIFAVFELAAVNFPELMPISEYRGRDAVA